MTFVEIAKAGELREGTMRRFDVAGRRILLANVAGRLYAVDDTCTHEEASLSEGPLTGEIVACPKHGSRFHLPSGRVLSLPAVRPVNTYEVKVEDGAVLVLPQPRRGLGMPHKVR
jgi:3-phenylpropionate/trans-cinnamate dioxygenase ferredoxin subunit